MENKRFKSILLTLIACIILLSNISLPVMAAGATVTTGASTGYNVNISNPDGHSEWNANYPQILIDGEIGFCIQPGYILSEGPGFTPSVYDKQEISIIAYEGWIRSNQTKEDYLATQFMIWEALGGRITSTSFGAYASYKSDIQNKINHHYDLPSFNNQSVTVNVGGSVTLVDSNNIFSGFNLVTSNGLQVAKSGNSLVITGTADAPENAIVIYNKIPNNYVGTSIAYRKNGSQDIAKLFVRDPLAVNINVKVNKYGSLSITKQDEDGNKVPNTTFALSKNADMTSPVGSYTTGGDGSVKVNELLPGTYYVQETAVPNHLVLDSTVRPVIVNANQTTDFNAQNNWVKGKVKLKKTDKESGKQIANAVYAIYNQQNQELERLITTAAGYVESGYLRFGQYSVKEVIAPEGYVLSDTVYPVTVSSNEQKIEVTGVNERVRGSINLTKEDSITGSTAQGEGTLEGAVYGLYARNDIKDPADGSVIYPSGEKVAELITDKEAKASKTDLYLGDYFLQEITPSEGYTLDETEYDLSITYQGQNVPIVVKDQTVKERVIAQAFSIIKVSSDESGEAENLEGVEFTVKAKKDIAKTGSWEAAPIAKNAEGKDGKILITDVNGQDVSDEYPVGTYVVRETKTPDDKYTVPDFEVVISEDSRVPQPWRIFNDQSFKAVLKIVKKDIETGKIVQLPNATFKIKNTDTDEYVSQWVWFPFPHSVNTWKTDESGQVHTNDVLSAGNYQLEEIKAPNGYVINKEPVKFKITNQGAYETLPDSKTPLITVELSDTSVKGKITVSKEGEVLTSADGKDGNINFVYELKKLQDAVFEIYAKEDILSEDNQGDIIYKKDALVDTVTTGKDGTGTSKLLPLGAYYTKEKKAPEGYTHSNEVKDVILEYKDQNTAVVFSETGSFINTRQKVEINTSKLDAESRDLVAGAEITLKANSDIKNHDGKVIVKKGTAIETAVTDSDGIAAYTADLPIDQYYENSTMPLNGKRDLDPDFGIIVDEEGTRLIGDAQSLFSVEETKAPVGYTSFPVRYFVDTRYTTQEQPVLTFEFSFENQKTKTEISKTDITDSKELPGASLEIRNINGAVVESWISTDKPHMIEGLPTGEYTLLETIPANGYVTAKNIKFTITDTMEIQKVNMVDDITKLQIIKTNEKGEILSGNTLAIFDENNNKIEEWLSTNQPHDITKLIVGNTYTLKELKAADGYTIAEDVAFTVRNTSEVQTVDMNNKKTVMHFNKLNEADEELPGAKLQVIEKESGKVFDEWISGETSHIIKGLVEGKEYIMKEISAPYGYETAEDIIFKAKDQETILMKDKLIFRSIQVNKVDSYTKQPIISKDFEFSVYKDSDCKEILTASQADKENGTATFKLQYGEWWIKETKAPQGYLLSEEVKHVEINDEGVFVDGSKINAEDAVYSFIYENQQLPALSTGDTTQVCIWLMLGITAFAGILLIIKRKKDLSCK